MEREPVGLSPVGWSTHTQSCILLKLTRCPPLYFILFLLLESLSKLISSSLRANKTYHKYQECNFFFVVLIWKYYKVSMPFVYSFFQSLWYISRIILEICKTASAFLKTIYTNSKTPWITCKSQCLAQVLSSSLKSKYLCQWTCQCHQNDKSLCHCVRIRQRLRLSQIS